MTDDDIIYLTSSPPTLLEKERDATITRLTAEVERLKTSGIAEVAAYNPSVMGWMKHWEDRTLKAEAELDTIRRAIPDAYILDPPDGGDVKTVEGVQRLTADNERLRAAIERAYQCSAEPRVIEILRTALTQEPRT